MNEYNIKNENEQVETEFTEEEAARLKESAEEYINEYVARIERSVKFVTEERYVDLLTKLTEKMPVISTDDDEWTEEIDFLFDFLVDNAEKAKGALGYDYNKEVFVEYEGKIINLFEMHGQGCFRHLSVHNIGDEAVEPCKDILSVAYEDIIEYVETGARQLNMRDEILLAVKQTIDEFGEQSKLTQEHYKFLQKIL